MRGEREREEGGFKSESERERERNPQGAAHEKQEFLPLFSNPLTDSIWRELLKTQFSEALSPHKSKNRLRRPVFITQKFLPFSLKKSLIKTKIENGRD